MNQRSYRKIVKEIASIIHHQPLAAAIYKSVASGLRWPFMHIIGSNTVRDVFKRSLQAAIRDIEKHPRGKLFRRLIEYGPHHPDDPESLTSDGETTLSDPECALCVQFIFSHMVNRFKGELAELLSIQPCLELVQQLQNKSLLPEEVNIYWGDMVQERRRNKTGTGEFNTHRGSFTKGADGLIVEQISSKQFKQQNVQKIHGVIEIKSMLLSKKKILGQIKNHISRLNGGVKLGGKIWPPDQISLSNTPGD